MIGRAAAALLAFFGCLTGAAQARGPTLAETVAESRRLTAACDLTGAWQQAQAALDQAETLRPNDPAAVMIVRQDLATLAIARRDFKAAKVHAEAATRIAETRFGAQSAPYALVAQNLAVAEAGLGDRPAARRRLNVVLEILKPLGDPAALMQAYGALADLELNADRLDSGLAHAKAAAEQAKSLPAGSGGPALLRLADAQRRLLALSEARRAADLAEARLTAAGDAAGRARLAIVRAAIDYEGGRFDDALEALRQADLQAAKIGQGCAPELRADIAYRRGVVHMLRREISEARKAYGEAILLIERVGLGATPRTAEATYGLAVAASFAGDYRLSETLFDRAISEFDRLYGPRSATAAGVRAEKAYMLIAAQAPDRAAIAAAEALAQMRTAEEAAPLDLAYATAAQAYAAGAAGDVAAARRGLTAAMAQFEAARGESIDLVPGLIRLAEYDLRDGRPGEAAPRLQRALRIQSTAGATGALTFGVTQTRLAEAALARGRRAEALTASAAAVDALRQRMQLGQKIPWADAVAERSRSREILEFDLALALPASGAGVTDPATVDRAFRAAQLAGALRTGSAVAQSVAAQAQGGALAERLRARQLLIDEWRVIEDRIGAALGAGAAPSAGLPEGALLARQGEILDALRRDEAELDAHYADWRLLGAASEVSATDVARVLQPSEALVLITSTEAATFAVALTRERRVAYRIALARADLEREVRHLRASLDPQAWVTAAPPPYDADAAHRLYKALLEPAAPLLREASQLLVVTDGALASLPLGVLVTEPPPPAPGGGVRDPAGLAWLVRRHEISTLPSAASAVALRRMTRAAPAPRPFFGVGDPVIGSGPAAGRRGVDLRALFEGRLADPRSLQRLAPLPETRAELQAMATALGGRADEMLLGAAASEPRVRAARLADYRVVAFATHGLVAGELEGFAEPGLVLSLPAQPTRENDGMLTASEVTRLRLNADWVILSACNTAAADGAPNAEALSGLTKAFIFAGARALLVSHWPVDSPSAAWLTTQTIDRYAREPRRAAALSAAQRRMIDTPPSAQWAHPFYWSPFVLVGVD